MNEILLKIGSCSIVILVFYIIKKVDDYVFFKRDEYKSIKLDKDSDLDKYSNFDKDSD